MFVYRKYMFVKVQCHDCISSCTVCMALPSRAMMMSAIKVWYGDSFLGRLHQFEKAANCAEVALVGNKIQILGWTRKQQHPLKMYYHMLEWMMSTSCSQKSAFMVPLLQYSIAVDRLRIAMVLILKKLPTKTTLVSGFWGEECFWMLATCLCPRSCSRAWRGRQCCWWSSWGSLVQDPLWKRLQLSQRCSSARSWKPRSHQTTQTWWGVALLRSWSGTNLS